MTFFGPDSYPGDGCDSFTERPKVIRKDERLADLPEHLTIMLLDSEVPHRLKAAVSRLMADAYRSGFTDGRQEGVEAVLEEPQAYLRPPGGGI